MTTKVFCKNSLLWIFILMLSILALNTSCVFFPKEPERENVPQDHILIPPPHRTDYIGINLEDSIAIFYSFKPYKGVIMLDDKVDSRFVVQWYNYKGESWLLLDGLTGWLHPNPKSFVSIHLQVSPKDWIVHKASVYFHDALRMTELAIPNVCEKLRKEAGYYFWGVSLAAREDVKVDIYKKESSEKCVKGVITGTFTHWSSADGHWSGPSRWTDPPYVDFYPEAFPKKKPSSYMPVDSPMKFQLSFTAIEAFKKSFDVIQHDNIP